MNDQGGLFDILSLPERMVTWVVTAARGEIPFGFLGSVLAVWKILAAFISVISMAIIIASLILTWRHRPQLKIRPSKKELAKDKSLAGEGSKVVRQGIVRPEWDALMKKCAHANEHQVVALILEADNVADEALKRLGIPGEDMGARMKALAGQLDSLDEFWSAHKTRNMIAHTPGFHVTLQDLERVLHQYHKALKELGAL